MNARRLLTLLGVTLLAGSAFAWWPRAAGSGIGAPAQGVLAPFLPGLLGAWEEVARIPAQRLGAGAILDLDERGDTLYVLQRDRWMRIAAGEVSEPYGSAVKGSPQWLASGTAIRAVPGGAVIIDRGRGVISQWTDDGSRVAEHDFRARTGLAALMEGVAASADGTLLVASRRVLKDGEGEWIVLRGELSATRFDTVYRGAKDPAEAEAHNVPRMAALPGGGFLLMPALEWRLISLAATTDALTDVRRQGGPRWTVPDSIQRGYARLIEQLPPAQRVVHALPGTFPPVRGVSVDAFGRVLVLVAAGATATHVELLTTSGTPIGRLWEAPEARIVFVANGGAFRVEESDDYTTVERLRPLPPRE